MRTQSAFLLALVWASLGAGKVHGAPRECPSGDDKCASQKSDGDVLLQSRTTIEEMDDSMEELIKDEAAEIEDTDGSDDEVEDTSEIVAEKDVCAPCDTACHIRTSKASFVECDADKNDKLTVTEVQECMQQQPSEPGVGLIELYTEAAQFVADHDEDKDNELTQDEFIKSHVPCGASLVEKTIASGYAVANCVGSSTKRCQKSTQSKQCSFLQTEGEQQLAGRRRRRGFGVKKVVKAAKKVVKCVVKTVKTWANCAVQAIPSFKDCWSNVVKGVSGGKMNLISNCNSLKSCKDTVVKGSKAVLDSIMTEAKKSMNDLLKGNELKKASKTVNKAWKQVQKTAGKVADTAEDVGDTMVATLKGIEDTIKSVNLDFCTGSGWGVWTLSPTDCGAFDKLASIFKSSVTRIPAIFKDVLKKFGQCVIKSAFLHVPTPFFDFKLTRWCVPTFIQKGIKGLVGTIQYFAEQIKNSGDCDGGAICTMASSIQTIGKKFKKLFDKYTLLQQSTEESTEVAGDASRDESDMNAKCKGSDFDIQVTLSGGLSFPPLGNGLTGGLTWAQGCYEKKYFGDLSFSFGGEHYITGWTTEYLLEAEMGAGISIGFNIGTPSRDTGISWSASATIAGKAAMSGGKVGVSLGFGLLPDPSTPTGFTFSPSIGAGSLLQRQTRQREIDAAVAQHETSEDKLYAFAGTLFNQMKNLDLDEVVEAGQLMSAIEAGTGAIQDGTGGWPELEEALLAAGLSASVCLTCADA